MKTVITPAEDRVRSSTSDDVNRKIDRDIQGHIQRYASSGKTVIKQRIDKLDKEWDIERTLELNASVLAFTGVILGATVNKKWLVLPGVVTAFLAQHAIQGWCPPLPVLRKLGVRTQQEIDAERYALVNLLKNDK